MDNFYIAQFIAAFAGCFYFASFQFRERKLVLLCIVCGAYCVALHFFVLGRATAGILGMISGTRVLSGYFTRHLAFMYTFIALAIGGFYWTYVSPLSILLLMSSLASTWAVFRASDRVLRLIYMAGTSTWLFHNILIWTPGGIILETVFLISNLIGYWRFYHARPSSAAIATATE